MKLREIFAHPVAGLGTGFGAGLAPRRASPGRSAQLVRLSWISLPFYVAGSFRAAVYIWRQSSRLLGQRDSGLDGWSWW